LSRIDFDNPQRWLFCMTHPDDEISICVTIARLVKAGHEVYMSWTHATPLRKAEARANALYLGVPDSNLFFHGSTDGSTCFELNELLPKFRTMMAGCAPEVVVCGAFEQGHLDHDATNWLVNQTFDGPVLEVPFYHTYVGLPQFQRINSFSNPAGQQEIPLTAEEQRMKLTVAKNFPSQNIWRVLMVFEIAQLLTLRKPMLRKRELVRLQTHKDFRTPNHPAPIAKRIEGSKRWKLWLSALDRLS
jgi:LmbE family N-acetylglucosaminyl deacetylase